MIPCAARNLHCIIMLRVVRAMGHVLLVESDVSWRYPRISTCLKIISIEFC